MIKFVCACGKHLRARDSMAMKRVFCPKCGSLVGVPSLQPAHPGAAPPMTPLERLKHARGRSPQRTEDRGQRTEDSPPAGSAPRAVRPVRLLADKVRRRPDQSGVHLEKHWYECLLYPLRAFRLCLGLAVLLTLLSAAVAMILPRLLAEPPESPFALVVFHWSWTLTVLLLLGVPCSFLEVVLESACAGESDYIRWSGNVAVTIGLGTVRWLACFLAGPVVFAGAGLLYWLSCGEPSWLDQLILAELGVVAIGSQIYVLLARADRGRLRDINPLAVADLAHRLGWGGLAVVLVAAVLFLLHGLAGLSAVPRMHQGAVVGWATLAAVWASAVYFSTFFARLLGIACFRTRKARAAAVGEGEVGEPST